MSKDTTVYIGLRVEPDLKAAVERLAEREDRSLSKWISRLLEREVKQAESNNG